MVKHKHYVLVNPQGKHMFDVRFEDKVFANDARRILNTDRDKSNWLSIAERPGELDEKGNVAHDCEEFLDGAGVCVECEGPCPHDWGKGHCLDCGISHADFKYVD